MIEQALSFIFSDRLFGALIMTKCVLLLISDFNESALGSLFVFNFPGSRFVRPSTSKSRNVIFIFVFHE